MMGIFVQLNEESRGASKWPVGYVIQENGCWEWVGSKYHSGYGSFYFKGRNRRAHKVLFEMKNGLVPQGMVLDHLCRNVACVNPEHLEVVSQRENVLRGNSAPAQCARKTHCPKGHRYSFENTYVPPNTDHRQCRACNAAREKLRDRRADV